MGLLNKKNIVKKRIVLIVQHTSDFNNDVGIDNVITFR